MVNSQENRLRNPPNENYYYFNYSLVVVSSKNLLMFHISRDNKTACFKKYKIMEKKKREKLLHNHSLLLPLVRTIVIWNAVLLSRGMGT